jgi:hypothetical protein
MNERICKIAQETDAWCDQRYLGEDSYNIEWETKFAELIVQECIELCAKEHAHSIHTHAGPWNTAIKRCKESIATHFGVEE